MHGRLISLPLISLILAALACSPLDLAGQTPTPVASPTLAAASPTATRLPQMTPTAPVASPTATATLAPPVTPTAPAASPTATPGPVGVNLSNSGKAEAPRLAFDGQGTLHLIWYDTSARAAGDYFHRQLTANGDWSKAENLTSDLQLVFADPSLMLAPIGQICASFGAAKVSGNPFTIGLYQRCQSGATWSPAIKLPVSKQPGVTLGGYSVVRGADGTAHAVFVASTTGAVYFDDTRLSGAGSAGGPALTIDKAGGYHAAWVSLGSPFTVQYRFSGDQGKTWQAAQTLSTDQNAPDGETLRLVSDSVGNVHLLWGGGDITYRRWTPAGGWGPVAALAGDQNGTNPNLAVDGQGLARAVWARHVLGLYYAVQAADGTWGAPRIVSNLQSGEPSLAVDAQGVNHIAWLTNKDVFYLAAP